MNLCLGIQHCRSPKDFDVDLSRQRLRLTRCQLHVMIDRLAMYSPDSIVDLNLNRLIVNRVLFELIGC
jgi:hypothetical protein